MAELDRHSGLIQAKMERLRKVWDSQRGPDMLNRKIEKMRQYGRKLDFKAVVKQVSN